MVRHKTAILVAFTILIVAILSSLLDPMGLELSKAQDFRTLEDRHLGGESLSEARFWLSYKNAKSNDFYDTGLDAFRINGIWIIRCKLCDTEFMEEDRIKLGICGGERWGLPQDFTYDPDLVSINSCVSAQYQRTPIQIAFVEKDDGGYEIIDVQVFDGDEGEMPGTNFLSER